MLSTNSFSMELDKPDEVFDTELWFPIASIPKDAKSYEVLLKNKEITLAHYACDSSGEYYPPFEGVFTRIKDTFFEVDAIAWRIPTLKLDL